VPHKYNPILLAALLSHEHWYVSFVMKKRVSDKCRSFTKDDYYPQYIKYLNGAHQFEEGGPAKCASFRRNVWKAGWYAISYLNLSLLIGPGLVLWKTS